jgi:hypothetical protein
MYREVHHFVGIHGSRKIAKEIRVSTRWKILSLEHGKSGHLIKNKGKKEVDLCVRRKCFRDDGGLG